MQKVSELYEVNTLRFFRDLLTFNNIATRDLGYSEATYGLAEECKYVIVGPKPEKFDDIYKMHRDLERLKGFTGAKEVGITCAWDATLDGGDYTTLPSFSALIDLLNLPPRTPGVRRGLRRSFKRAGK